MNHRVNLVQKLYEDALWLDNNVVKGTDASADAILNDLSRGIENLKSNWRGKDAGVAIQSVTEVYNAMASLRDNLASLSADSSKVASNYRRIQNANRAGLEDISPIAYDYGSVPRLQAYTDTADTVEINPSAEAGRNYIDAANNAIERFESNVKTKYQDIMENWQAGDGRDKAQAAFDTFTTNVARYRQTLADVSSDITKALQNYTL